MSYKISVDIRSWYDSSPEYTASIYYSLSSGGIIESSLSLSVLLQVLVNTLPSSNCVNVIMSPACSLKDVTQGGYVTAGRIDIASE